MQDVGDEGGLDGFFGPTLPTKILYTLKDSVSDELGGQREGSVGKGA